jgi:tRNA pseudouridine38-40 synthase
MPRYRLLLEYDGGPFQGWQRQGDAPTVQGAIEAALFACSGEAAAVFSAGRTDAGVHALGQVTHVDLTRDWLPERLTGALNFHLRPNPIAVLETREAAPDFHARFSCTGRRYLYRILARRSPPALERGRVWHVPVHLDAERMHVAAQALVGRHDFTSFRSSECQSASPVKTLSGIHVVRAGEIVECCLWARSFLHHQVRNIVGTLKKVGEGKAPIGWVQEVLAARDRGVAGQTAPAEGLFLVAAEYDAAIDHDERD